MRHLTGAMAVLLTASEMSAAADVAVVKGTYGIRAVPSEARGIEQFYGLVAQCLKQAGVEFQALTDDDVAAGQVKDVKLVILPYSPQLAKDEAARLRTFLDAGGKVIAFYCADRDLLHLLGLRYLRHVPQRRPGDFASMRFRADSGVANVPAVVKQASWNIGAVEPAAPDVHVAATWFDRDGRDTGLAAVLVGPRGAYLTHVLLDDDLETKTQMMLALVGHFVPEVWRRGAETMCDRARNLLRRAEERLPDLPADQRGRAQALADRARSHATTQEGAAAPAAAWTAARQAEKAAADAFYATFPSRANEFRGVWIHTAYGVADWGWEKTAAVLAQAGFNAVVPNVCFAGQADYQSAVIAVDPRVERQGDQVALCVAAAHRHGLEVHAWRVNWNLGGRGPRDFVERLRAAGRLQRNPQGKALEWLCPSHPDNVALERDAMLELVRNYDLDGVHFDYIRYPGPEGCYCDGCRERFEKEIGRKAERWPEEAVRGALRGPYLDFRRAQITRLVAAVAAEARRIKPGIKVSAAVFNNYAAHRDAVGQDWVAWVKAGYLDFVCPMDYTARDDAFRRMVADQVRLVERRVPVYPGIGAGTGTDWTATPEATIRQVLLTRDLGADGFMVFQYTEDLGTRFLPALAAGVTSLPSTPPHRTPTTRPGALTPAR
jgi:uncharacterized lipoprotein YddW (UPF0748 family)